MLLSLFDILCDIKYKSVCFQNVDVIFSLMLDNLFYHNAKQLNLLLAMQISRFKYRPN